ncbi:MAG: hypothetical protein AAF219_08765 [Myxococcota bacterium]
MTLRHFPYRLDKRWTPLFFALGVSDDDGVTITDSGILKATYGHFSVRTDVENVKHTTVTGPHRWYTAVGLRLAFSNDGVTFGTNHKRGLSIAFVERISKVIGFRKHSRLWVSVAEPEELAGAIDAARRRAAPS